MTLPVWLFAALLVAVIVGFILAVVVGVVMAERDTAPDYTEEH